MSSPGRRAGGDVTAVRAVVHGRVQGVGFRWTTHRRLREWGLDGEAVNLPDGTVVVRARGAPEDVDRLVAWLRGGSTPGYVTRVDVE